MRGILRGLQRGRLAPGGGPPHRDGLRADLLRQRPRARDVHLGGLPGARVRGPARARELGAGHLLRERRPGHRGAQALRRRGDLRGPQPACTAIRAVQPRAERHGAQGCRLAPGRPLHRAAAGGEVRRHPREPALRAQPAGHRLRRRGHVRQWGRHRRGRLRRHRPRRAAAPAARRPPLGGGDDAQRRGPACAHPELVLRGGGRCGEF
mmetsp:Transcript_20253/g.63917  ORF Transcript_20253/g.63917 Transcript_20253/m.63917 type:complete len:208 (-) Transcript_20253:380-1003(-)